MAIRTPAIRDAARGALTLWCCGLCALSATAVVGCGSDSGSSVSYGGGGYTGGGSASGGGGPSGQPMVAVVDTGQTFTSESMQGGQGVGVFVEYQAGGHWSIQWTCDTAITGLDCNFHIDATLTNALPVSTDAGVDAAGAAPSITNAVAQLGSITDTDVQVTPTEVFAGSNTRSEVDAMTFDAPPGAMVTVDVKLNGEESGAFFFFVQDRTVNGGYKGVLSDPLTFEPSSP
jgi:hypothetical protein